MGFAIASVTVVGQGKSWFMCGCSCCSSCSGRGFGCTACGAKSVNARAGTRDVGGSGCVRGWGKGHKDGSLRGGGGTRACCEC